MSKKHQGMALRILLLSLLISAILLPAQTKVQSFNLREKTLRLDLEKIPKARDSAIMLQRKNEPAQFIQNRNTIDLRPGDYVSARVRESAKVLPQMGNRTRLSLPWDVYSVADDGRQLNMKLIVEIEGGGFRVKESGQFVTSLFLGVLGDAKQEDKIVLKPPVMMHVSADADTTSPHEIPIDHTNLPLAQVNLEAINPSDPVMVSIRPSYDLKPYETAVSVIRPTLTMHVTPESIEGLGLEKATLTVMVKGLVSPSGALVTLNTDKGGLKPTQLKLDDQGSASSSIRSIGTGIAHITAENRWTNPAEAELKFQWPWKSLIAVVIGSVAGAIIKKREFIIALACGFGLAVLYSIGINIAGVTPSADVGEALVAGFALIGSIGGPTLFEKTIGAKPEKVNNN